jgi:hypothetical protein
MSSRTIVRFAILFALILLFAVFVLGYFVLSGGLG